MPWQQRQNILWAKRQFHPMWECREDRKYYDDVDEQEDGKRRSHSFAAPCVHVTKGEMYIVATIKYNNGEYAFLRFFKERKRGLLWNVE